MSKVGARRRGLTYTVIRVGLCIFAAGLSEVCGCELHFSNAFYSSGSGSGLVRVLGTGAGLGNFGCRNVCLVRGWCVRAGLRQ